MRDRHRNGIRDIHGEDIREGIRYGHREASGAATGMYQGGHCGQPHEGHQGQLQGTATEPSETATKIASGTAIGRTSGTSTGKA